jgi:hypothetical protein
MLCLAREVYDLRFGPFALRYILEAVDGADNVPIAILDSFDVNERDATRAVRSLNVHFPFAHGNTGAQHVGHGALMVRKQTAVGAEHSIRSAKPFSRIAKSGRTAPQFGGPPVVSKNETLSITNINGKRQLFEQPRGQLKGVFLVTQAQGDARYFRDHLKGTSQRFAPEGTWLVGRYVGHLALIRHASGRCAAHPGTATAGRRKLISHNKIAGAVPY